MARRNMRASLLVTMLTMQDISRRVGYKSGQRRQRPLRLSSPLLHRKGSTATDYADIYDNTTKAAACAYNLFRHHSVLPMACAV